MLWVSPSSSKFPGSRAGWLFSLVVFSIALSAQETIANGTILPVRLNSTLDSRNRPGRGFSARVMQDVPGTSIRAGAKALGRIVSAKPAKDGSGAQLTLRFDSVEISQRTIPLSADLRALASMMEVARAQAPLSGPDRGTPAASWTTRQIGGEVVYRGGGPVARGLRSVGVPAPNGVLVRAFSPPGSACRGEIDGNDRLQAFWVFSSDACGVYGFRDLEIMHAGRKHPAGEIVLTSGQGNFHVASGSGLLLRVNAAQPAED